MSHNIVHRQDYQPPAWLMPELALEFDLGIESTEVRSRFVVRRGPGPEAALQLDGEHMELLDVHLDDRALDPSEYQLGETGLTIPGAHDGCCVQTRVRIHPRANTALEGLYLSGDMDTGFLLTQCEAQGFRRITYFPDRPDVLARYTVTLRAERARFPVLLAGGNPDGAGDLDDGRHWVRYVDPWPKPSYLFALVAGKLEYIERQVTTAEGRQVQVRLWSEAHTIERCRFAMDALLRAMRWDEQSYGRCFDLDVFNVVATQDFNMGAMENKGLNIFNAKYLLIDPDSSSDEDYRRVEAVIGHEYFHNWSGNRVTCRDWFELSLKEGFTVFREQSFGGDMTSRLVQRIDDVSRLKQVQFAEDAGPLAHPVRPDSYSEINNFYTATVYEKGAELVRMMATRLGPECFRRGTDLYFSRHDGQAVTIDDFVAALGDANALDMRRYLAWYAQAGTPRLTVESRYDAGDRTLTLDMRQTTEATPGQPHKKPLPIPVATLLLDTTGEPLSVRLGPQGRTSDEARILELTEARQRFVYHDVAAQPVVSLLRGLSAPVHLQSNASHDDLAVLLRFEADDYNRWQAGATLAERAFGECMEDQAGGATATWCQALAATLHEDRVIDASLLALLLTAPGESQLGEAVTPLDPHAVHVAREALLTRLANAIGAHTLVAQYRQVSATDKGDITPADRGQRRLKNALLRLLCRADRETGLAQAHLQWQTARPMTDRLAALELALRHRSPDADAAVGAYRERYATDLLALDKWLALQATIPGEATLERVRQLMRDPCFKLGNPNKVQALIGSFSRANPDGFHRADGGGVTLLAEVLAEADTLNPQLAARLANGFNGWQRLEPGRREHARQALASLAAREHNSRGLAEMISRLTAAEADADVATHDPAEG